MSFRDRFAAAAKAAISIVATPASDELFNERIAICDACPFLTTTRNCRKCGCFVDAKARLEGQSCPITKW